jgi:cytochrome c peroxidase
VEVGRRARLLLGVAALATLVASVRGVAALRGRTAAAGLEPPMRQWLDAAADTLDRSLERVSQQARGGRERPASNPAVRLAFERARLDYKRLEGVLEFYAPALAAALNLRRQEVDDDDAPPPATLAAGGFPALERLLYPTLDANRAAEVRSIVGDMRSVVRRVRSLGGALAPTDAQLVELARLEIARVSTLGIAGFDTPRIRSGALTIECSAALDGIAELFAFVGPRRWPSLGRQVRAVDSTLTRASRYLRSQIDVDGFDRLTFIVSYAEPTARAVDALRRAAGVVPLRLPRAWRSDVASVYDSGAFNARVYANAEAPATTASLVALGQRLFFDPVLSGNGTRACASCHSPSRAFTDGLAKEARLDGRGNIPRHTPTLLNAALQPAQFADERAATLEDQVARVLESRSEMGSSVERAARAVATAPGYQEQFVQAFRVSRVDAVTPLRLRFALAAYVRSLVALESRFDRAARGDVGLLSSEERRGFNLFMGKAGCGTCHFAPLFNGATPPLYVSSDVEVIGTPVAPNRPGIPDSDSGRAGIDGLSTHYRAFKTPTLRNVALTAPYMHNGAFSTLEEVLAFYDGGGGAGAGAPILNQTLATDSLRLGATDRLAIIAFLRTLTDTMPATRRIVRVRLPRGVPPV